MNAVAIRCCIIIHGNYVNVPSDFSTPFLLSIGDDESEVDCPIMGEARWATATPAIKLSVVT
jgi:hypothetical protein